MSRLTYETDNGEYTGMPNSISIRTALEKLAKLEDIEDEFGIDLTVLIKALKGIYIKDKERIYFVGSPYLCFVENSERQLEFQLRVVDTWYYIKDYGKSWALRREELESDE